MGCCSLPSGPLPLQLDPQQRWARLAWESECWRDRAAGVAGDGTTLIPQASALAVPPAQGQPLLVKNKKLPKASTANCPWKRPRLCQVVRQDKGLKV